MSTRRTPECTTIERMFPARRTHSLCFFPGCERPMAAKGLCQSHYRQQLRTGSLWPLGSRRQIRVECDFGGVISRQQRAGFALLITSSSGRASHCVRCDPSTAGRASAATKDARDLGSTVVGASDTPRSTIPAAHSRLFSVPRRTATFPVVRDLITPLGTAKVIGGNC
jgi:hypothetical protein